MYNELNLNAKEYLIPILEKKYLEKYPHNNEFLARCYKEINILYRNNLLFIIEYLYKYKLINNDVKYWFNGPYNNLLLLYILDINQVNPIKYHLPTKLFSPKTLELNISNDYYLGFIDYLDNKHRDIRVISKKYKDTYYENKDYYYILPTIALPEEMQLKFNEDSILETSNVNPYYNELYISIKISEKYPIINYEKIGVENSLDNDFEKNLKEILNPHTFEDYVKIKCLARSSRCWKENQEYLVKANKIDISTIIASREDIYEYLQNHKIPEYYINEIILLVKNGIGHSPLWNTYKEIMLKSNCSFEFINILEKIRYISNRGEGISSCLYALDKNNYV